MVKFKRLRSSSHEFEPIVAGRGKVLETCNEGEREEQEIIERDGATVSWRWMEGSKRNAGERGMERRDRQKQGKVEA